MLKAIAVFEILSNAVASLNGETGAITLTSSGGTVTITTPTSSTINLESVATSSIPQANYSIVG